MGFVLFINSLRNWLQVFAGEVAERAKVVRKEKKKKFSENEQVLNRWDDSVRVVFE